MLSTESENDIANTRLGDASAVALAAISQKNNTIFSRARMRVSMRRSAMVARARHMIAAAGVAG